MKKIAIVLLMMFPVLALTAQSDDPAIQKAKEETAEVYDLGRFFGYLLVMEQEETSPALSKDQMSRLYETLVRFMKIERINIDDARETLISLEEELLTIDQLIYVDELAIEKMEARVTGKGSGSSGGGLIQNYLAGGAFNPLTDMSKPIGQDVSEFMAYLKKALDK